MTLVPEYLFHRAMRVIEGVLHEGAKKHERDSWRQESINHHCRHACAHIVAHELGDDSEDHLAHAATRLLMLLELREGKDG